MLFPSRLTNAAAFTRATAACACLGEGGALAQRSLAALATELTLSRWVISVVTVVLLAVPSFAQNRVSEQGFESTGWRFKAIISGSLSQPHVEAIIGLADADRVFGNNVVGLLYRREGAVWNCKAWPATTRAAVVKNLSGEFQLSDISELCDAWQIGKQEVTDAPPTESAMSFYKGLFASDPLSMTLEFDANRSIVVEWLTEAGYASTAQPIELMATSCRDNLMSWFADSIEQPAPDREHQPAPTITDCDPTVVEKPCIRIQNFSAPSIASSMECGEWGMRIRDIAEVAIDLPLQFANLSTHLALQATCYNQVCKAVYRRSVSWWDWGCDGFGDRTGVYYEYRVYRWTNICCKEGSSLTGGPGAPLPSWCNPTTIQFTPETEPDVPTDPSQPYPPPPGPRHPVPWAPQPPLPVAPSTFPTVTPEPTPSSHP